MAINILGSQVVDGRLQQNDQLIDEQKRDSLRSNIHALGEYPELFVSFVDDPGMPAARLLAGVWMPHDDAIRSNNTPSKTIPIRV